MDEDSYEDLVEEAMDDYDTSHDYQEAQLDQAEGYTYPKQQDKSDLFTWFWKVTKLRKPFELIRAGNLKKEEIGEHKFSIRNCMHLAQLSEVCGHNVLATYFRNMAAVNSASSMGRDGWFMDLSISQRRIRERSKKSEFTPAKRKMFGRKSSRGENDN